MAALLKDVHDAVRGVRTEIDLSTDTPWSRQLAAILTQISQALTAVIELIPGRVRQLLRPPKETFAGGRLNEDDVAETEALVGFVTASRNYASELAVNEITLRTFSELQQYLDSSTHTLLDALRVASPPSADIASHQVVPRCGFYKIFGRNMRLLAKASGRSARHRAQGRQGLMPGLNCRSAKR